jgi:hypothetical protein
MMIRILMHPKESGSLKFLRATFCDWREKGAICNLSGNSAATSVDWS